MPPAALPDPYDSLPLVLVVDDETRSLDSIRRNLEEDFRILTASSADEAAIGFSHNT